MDDCERLYRRLVHNTRASAPELLGRPFEVSRIYQQLVSYRDNRNVLEFTTNDEYELALCQLLAGTRGFLQSEPEMQHAVRAELESPNPDLSVYRGFSTARVSFGVDALRAEMLRPTPQSTRSVAAPSPANQSIISARPTEAVDTPMEQTRPAGVKQVTASVPPVAKAPAPSVPRPSTQPSSGAPSMPVARPVPPVSKLGASCRYCSGTLPEGRSVVFCPTCGHNLTVKHCPACNSELEVGWKFCITCGRDSGAS